MKNKKDEWTVRLVFTEDERVKLVDAWKKNVAQMDEKKTIRELAISNFLKNVILEAI